MLLFCIYTISIDIALQSLESVVQKKVYEAYLEHRPFLEKFSRKDSAATIFVDRYAMN